jgi:hypothetical protein
MNSFFRVVGDRGFQVYRHVGCSRSNTYVGSSRVVDAVMEAVNLREGDEVHVLAGGTFVISGGVVSPVSLRPPKHIFEKEYGNPPSDAEVMRGQVRKGLAVETAAPLGRPDYVGARDRVSANLLRDLHPQMIHVDDSPELQDIASVADAFVAENGGAGAGWSVRKADRSAYGGPKVVVERDGVRLYLSVGAPGVYSVETPASMAVEGHTAPIEIGARKVFHFRAIDGVAAPLAAARDFLAACGRELCPGAPAPGF